jgi:hypothetical protein
MEHNGSNAGTAVAPKIGIVPSIAGSLGFIGAIWVAIRYPSLAVAAVAVSAPLTVFALLIGGTPATSPLLFLCCVIAALFIVGGHNEKGKSENQSND